MGKKYLLTPTLLLCLIPATAQAKDIVRAPDQVSYNLNLDYQTPHVLWGTQSIRFHNPLGRPLKQIWIRLWANGLSGCKHRHIGVRMISGARLGAWKAGCTALPLKLAHPIPSNGYGQVKLHLRVTTPNRNDRFGRLHGVDLWGYALPTLAVHDEQGWHNWEQFIDLGESFYTLTSSWKMRIKAPVNMQLATSGVGKKVRSSKRSAIWQFQAPRARDFMIMGGKMHQISGWQDGVHIRVWKADQYKEDSDLYPAMSRAGVLTWAKRAVKSYNSWFGYYNQHELDVFYDPNVVSMEFSGLITTIPEPSVIVHETAHQWWYYMVGNDQYRSPWLDESLAEYTTIRLMMQDQYYREMINPCDPLVNPDYNKMGSTGIPLSANMGVWNQAQDDGYVRDLYLWGACRFIGLTKKMGEPRTTGFFHDLFDHYRGGVLTTDQMLVLLRRWKPAGFDMQAWIRESHIQPGS